MVVDRWRYIGVGRQVEVDRWIGGGRQVVVDRWIGGGRQVEVDRWRSTPPFKSMSNTLYTNWRNSSTATDTVPLAALLQDCITLVACQAPCHKNTPLFGAILDIPTALTWLQETS